MPHIRLVIEPTGSSKGNVMSTTEATTRTSQGRSTEPDEAAHPGPAPDTAEVEVLVEEISIDGMCGVY